VRFLIQISQDKLDTIFNKFSDKRILVIGDLMLDEYLVGNVSRISPEAPVPVVEIKEQRMCLGGAANVALNIASLGSVPIVVGAIGDDIHGDTLLDLLAQNRVLADGVIRILDKPTSVKTRIIGDSQQVARVDREAVDYLNKEQEKRILEKIEDLLNSVDGIVIQDYNKGVLTETAISEIIKRATNKDLLIAVDPKFKYFLKYQKVTIFKPNITETEQALAIKINSEDDLETAGQLLMEKIQADNILITRGSNGMTLFEKDERMTHISTRAREVADVSGAGDTVIGILTAVMLTGASIQEAATLANHGAGLVCAEVGIVPVNKNKLYKASLGKSI
jgi:rfaE bifunctional protein kinase chain/domain